MAKQVMTADAAPSETLNSLARFGSWASATRDDIALQNAASDSHRMAVAGIVAAGAAA
jgi:hypothetical protein